MTDNNGFSTDGEDGGIVFSIRVPELPRVQSAPCVSLCLPQGGACSTQNSLPKTEQNGHVGHSEKDGAEKKDEINQANLHSKQKMEMSKEELARKYSLHVFVGLIFLVTVLSVSLAWYYRKLALDSLHSSQTIFFDPRTRILTLLDPSHSKGIKGVLGLDMPQWQLPLHCPIVQADNPHAKECRWKNNAILRIAHFSDDNVQCYNVSWESLHKQHVPHDCFDVAGTGTWYGPSNQSQTSFPISGEFVFQPLNFSLENNGVFSSVVDFYWISSSGFALFVDPDNPIHAVWNNSGDGKLCVMSNYTGPFYNRNSFHTPTRMNYTLCSGRDLLSTHLYMQDMLSSRDVQFLSDDMFRGPYWSLKSAAPEGLVSQESFLDLVNKLQDYEFMGSKIIVDGDWQEKHGDLEFDRTRFPNATSMVDAARSSGCHVTLSVSPYFEYRSPNFHQGVLDSRFVRDAGGHVTGLIGIRTGLAAILDVFGSSNRHWFRQKLLGLSSEHGPLTFHLSYGSRSWLPYKPHFLQDNATPNMYRKLLTETMSSVSKSLLVDHTSGSRHVTQLIPVSTHIGHRGGRKCLVNVLETSLTLGLIGYPFVMADGLEVERVPEGEEGMETDRLPSRELYIRWLQMSSFFPAVKFSIPPWKYDKFVVSMAANMSAVHEVLVVPELQSKFLREQVKLGFPILRPVWWRNSSNSTVHGMKIDDQFLVGDSLLVAPVLCEGMTSRDIYVPPGVWEDLRDETFVLGPCTLTGYKVDLADIAVFKKREMFTAYTKRKEL